jgi:hypothetical protein
VQSGGPDAILGQGRIEHHEGGGGIISFMTELGDPAPRHIIRSISRAYPRHTITDGFGNVIEQKEENMSRKHIKEVIHRLMEAKRSLKGQKGLQPWSTPSPYEVHSDSPVSSRRGASHEERTSAANIRTWQWHIDRLASEIMRHENMKPGWRDSSGNVSQEVIDRHLAELRKFHKHFTQKQEIAVANHNAGNFEANKDHYTDSDPVGQRL